MPELIQYHNDLNLLPLGKLSALEQNFLFRVIQLVKEQGCKQLFVYDKEAFKSISQSRIMDDELLKIARGTANKFINLVFKRYIPRDDGLISERYSNLFEHFEIVHENNKELKAVRVKVGEEFAYLTNQLFQHFTQIGEIEHAMIKNKHAKILYREILSKHKMTNHFEIKFDDLKEKLGLDKDYSSCNLDKILMQIKKELTQKEPNIFTYSLPLAKFEWKKTYKGLGGGRKGKALNTYIFEFEKKPTTTEKIVGAVKNKWKRKGVDVQVNVVNRFERKIDYDKR